MTNFLCNIFKGIKFKWVDVTRSQIEKVAMVSIIHDVLNVFECYSFSAIKNSTFESVGESIVIEMFLLVGEMHVAGPLKSSCRTSKETFPLSCI